MNNYEKSIKVLKIKEKDRTIRIIRTTQVTGKGQIYFINKFVC